jgi:hypothetical protein
MINISINTIYKILKVINDIKNYNKKIVQKIISNNIRMSINLFLLQSAHFFEIV